MVCLCLFSWQNLLPMNHYRLEKNSLEPPDWHLLANSFMIWVFLTYQVVIRETYVFPHVIAFPYIVFIFTNIASTMHTVCSHYKEIPLVYSCLKSICPVLSTFTLSISILESIIFVFIWWMFPDKMLYYTTIESGHNMCAIFIRAVPLLSNVLIFSNNDTSLGLPNLLLAIIFFSVYYHRLCAYLPDNNGVFVHRFLDYMTDNERVFLFTILLPAMSSIVMFVAFCIKYVITGDGHTVYHAQVAARNYYWMRYLLLCALCIIACTYHMKTDFKMHITELPY